MERLQEYIVQYMLNNEYTFTYGMYRVLYPITKIVNYCTQNIKHITTIQNSFHSLSFK